MSVRSRSRHPRSPDTMRDDSRLDDRDPRLHASTRVWTRSLCQETTRQNEILARRDPTTGPRVSRNQVRESTSLSLACSLLRCLGSDLRWKLKAESICKRQCVKHRFEREQRRRIPPFSLYVSREYRNQPCTHSKAVTWCHEHFA